MSKEIGRAAADNHAVAARGHVVNNRMEGREHLVGVERVVSPERKRSLVASPRIHLEQAVEQRIDAFVASLRNSGFDVGLPRNFGGEFLIPEFPAEPLRELLRDLGAAAPVLALDGDDSDLDRSPLSRKCTAIGSFGGTICNMGLSGERGRPAGSSRCARRDLVHVNLGFNRHAQTKVMIIVLPLVEHDFHGNTLHNFHVVTGRVFRRQ